MQPTLSLDETPVSPFGTEGHLPVDIPQQNDKHKQMDSKTASQRQPVMVSKWTAELKACAWQQLEVDLKARAGSRLQGACLV